MDVQDDASQRVLGVAVVKARRPRDGVVADELVVRIPEGREGRGGRREGRGGRRERGVRKTKKNRDSDTHRWTGGRLTWSWPPAAARGRRWPGTPASCPRARAWPAAGTAPPRAPCTPRWGGRPPPCPLCPSASRELCQGTKTDVKFSLFFFLVCLFLPPPRFSQNWKRGTSSAGEHRVDSEGSYILKPATFLFMRPQVFPSVG